MNLITVLYNIILSPITQIIEISYRVFDKMFDNTGIALVGVSLTVTLLCLPLYIVAESWQETERAIQDRMKGGIDRIKKYFKGDEQYMILNTYYRQNHYHPIMALRSSFGILIQIPFFLAAYHILSSLPDLMGKSFLFIKDMGRPDAVFTINGFAINILPIAMTIINCVSGAIYSKGHGIREKIQIYGMALLFLVVLYNSPAGLVVYWTMNNLFSLVKNIFYKMKNPLKVFYICVCTALIGLAVYILFIYGGGAGMKKRGPAALFLLILIPVPLYLKGIDYIISSILTAIKDDSKKRFIIFFTCALALTILNGLVLPSGLISSSVQEFSNIENYTNPNQFLHSSFWMSFGLIVFWPGCIYFLFKEKVQTILSSLYACLLLGAVINAFAFSGDYGSMDSTLKFIDGFKNPSALFMAVNCLVILLSIFVIGLLFKFKLIKAVTNCALISVIAFTGLSVLNTSKITKAYNEFQKIALANKAEAEEGFKTKFHLSKTEKNIVIFMLDRFESAWVNPILNDQPALKEKLSGFTYYPNTLAFNGHTLMGSPGVYGGYEYIPWEMNQRADISLKEKHNQALLLLPTILIDNGFEAVVSDLSWANYSYIADMSFAQNIPHLSAITLLSKYSGDFKKEKLLPGKENLSLAHVINRNLFWVSLFREVPSPLRSIVYYKGTWWENGVKESSSSFADWFSCLYFMNKITSVDSEKPTLSIITNECTHSSEDTSMWDVKLDGEYSNKDPAYAINTAALGQIGAFADYLKEQEIYDNTKIIVVSDHGIGKTHKNLYTTTMFENYDKDRLNPVLLVKDFDSNESIKIDSTFMTNADVPWLALKNVVENPVNPFTGKAIGPQYKYDAVQNDGLIVTKGDIFMPYHSKSKNTFTLKDDEWFKVKDNIFEDKNWSKLVK